MRGGALLVRTLAELGADRAFGVPGESFLAVLDAMLDEPRLDFVTTRHESGAGFMAVADAKLTGQPGVAVVTRGPGAMNAAIAVHTAQQDSAPLILLVGQVPTSVRGREAFQEMDYRAVFGSVAKWAAEIDAPERVPEMVARAWAVATSGRPGPVVLALPEDMQRSEAGDPPPLPPAAPAVARPDPGEVARAAELLAAAERPLILVGGGRWSAEAGGRLRALAERHALPVAAEFRRQDYIANASPAYVGDLGLAMPPYLKKALAESDVVLALGAQLGEIPTAAYTLLCVPEPAQTLVQVAPEAGELGRVYRPDLGIVADAPAFVAALETALGPVAADPERTAALKAGWEAARRLPPAPGGVDPAAVVAHIDAAYGERAVVANGAGNYTVWLHKGLSHPHYGAQLAPVCGTMGFGVPAAVAAAMRRPDRPVFGFAGDGCFLMTGQELATAVAHGLRIVFVVVNNGMLGTIRMHQERTYPGRVSATDLTNPDFAAFARSFGARGVVVERTEDFADRCTEAVAADGPTLIELRVDPEALTPNQTLSEIRRAGG